MRFRASAEFVSLLAASLVGCTETDATGTDVEERRIDDGAGAPIEAAEEPAGDANAAAITSDASASAADASSFVVLIDDAEDGDERLLVGDGLPSGRWRTFDDRQQCEHPDFASGNTATCGETACAASGMIIPVPEAYGGAPLETVNYADAVMSAPPPDLGSDENGRGIRIQASAFTFHGAGVTVELGEGAPYDLRASGFDGVRFLARSGISTSTIALSVRMADAYSEPAGGHCIAQSSVCDAATCSCEGGVQGCFDDPTAPVGKTFVTGGWQLYEIPFSAFERAGTGRFADGDVAPTKLEPSAVYRVEFLLRSDGEPMPEFDLWLDDIGFFTASSER